MRHAPPRALGAIVLSAEPDRRKVARRCDSMAFKAPATVSDRTAVLA
jgi:hypothetical protein